MEQCYFDQNITNIICKNSDFSDHFFETYFKPLSKLIITPFSLIELSGRNIMDCLITNKKYNIKFSDLLKNQTAKAYEYYKNNIREDIITFLEEGLKAKEEHTKTELSRHIVIKYQNYLNSIKGKEDICQSIVFDRVSALPLESFKDKNAYLDILRTAFTFFRLNPHFPFLRLLIKSCKKLPPPITDTEKEMKKYLRKIIETSDLKENHDLVDTEMIQFAFMGYDNHPVHLYTKDNSETIKKRLFLFHTSFNNLRSCIQGFVKDGIDISDTKVLSLEEIKKITSFVFKFGKISIVNDSGYIEENIDVKSLVTTNAIYEELNKFLGFKNGNLSNQKEI